MIAALLLLTAACSSSGHSSTTSSAPQRASVRVTYTATIPSSATKQTTISYTDPLDGSQASAPGKAGWLYTYPQVPVSKPIALQVRVAGPDPARNSCAIRINGHKVIGQSGQSGTAPGTAVTCDYTLSPSNA
jgi:hypothetical protein